MLKINYNRKNGSRFSALNILILSQGIGAGYSYFAQELSEVEEMDINESGISFKIQFNQLNSVSMSGSMSEDN